MPEPCCDWVAHQEAMAEAGFCPVCGEGKIDREWAMRHGFSEEDLDGN